MASMTQEQMDQRIAELGGAQATHSPVIRRERIRNPKYNPNDFRSNEPEYLELDVQQWRSPDGVILQAYLLPDGTWEVTRDDPPAPKTPAATTNPATSTTGASSQITGTPTAYDGQGRPTAWDNSRPVRLWQRPDGSVVGTPQQLTADERDEWERGRNEAAGKGRKTDKELEAAAGASGSVPVDTHPGYTKHTTRRRNPTTGVDETETFYTDPQGNRVAGLPEKPKDATTQLVTINGQPGYRVTTTPQPNGAPPKIEWFDPSGKPMAQPPVQAGQPSVSNTTVNGQVYTTVTTINPDGTVKQEHRGPDGKPIAQIPQAGLVNLPPDAPRVDSQDPDEAFRQYQQLYSYVNNLVLQGKLTAQQGKDALAGPHSQVGMLLDRQKDERDRAAGLRRDQLTERSQDMTQAGNRLSAANTAASTAIRQSSDLIEKAAGGSSTIVPLMVLQAGMGQAYGGFRESPNVALNSGLFPGGQPASPKPSAPGTVGTGGNALGVGSVPGVMTPGAKPPPLFRPQPPAAYPGAPAPQNAGQGTGEPPARGNVPPTPRPPAAPAAAAPSAAAEPPARGNIPSQSARTITVRHRGTGAVTQITQAEWDSDPARQPEWEIIPGNELGQPGDPGYGAPAQPYGKPGANPTLPTDPNDPDNRPPSGTVIPYTPPLPPNEQTMTSGGWTPVQTGQSEILRPGEPPAGAPALPSDWRSRMEQATRMDRTPSGVWDGGGDMAPTQVLKSGMGYGGAPRNMDELSQQLLGEGFSPAEIEAARQRAMRRAGLVA